MLLNVLELCWFMRYSFVLFAESKFCSIGPIYYEFGSLVITFDDSKKAVSAFYKLREEKYDNRPLLGN